jgi:hypothetical protein
MGGRLLGGLAVAAGALLTAYVLAIRPWHLRWGATEAEARQELPGDELLSDAKLEATHAITIDAPASRVWPWLVQVGQGRAGFYSYDWLENLGGLDTHSADRILPELQQLKVGDTIPMVPNGFGPEVAILEPDRALVLYGDSRVPGSSAAPTMKPGDYISVSWGFYLEPLEEGTTRLIERFRLDYNPNVLNTILNRGMLEPGSFVMEQKMLRGIKERAERTA